MDIRNLILEQYGTRNPGQYRDFCPDCHSMRRNKQDRSLSVEVTGDHVKYRCWHCELAGAVRTYEPRPYKPTPIVRVQPMNLTGLTENGANYLRSRKIDPDVAERVGIMSATRYFGDIRAEREALAFVHRDKDGKVVSAKYRSLEGKHFSAQGRMNSYWGLSHAATGSGPVVITEGELDAASLVSVGLRAISVPTGASTPRGDTPESKYNNVPTSGYADRHLDLGTGNDYVISGQELYDTAPKVVLFTDTDEPGRLLGDELARRIGKYRCYRATPPDGCKDANDVLVKHGPDTLKSVVDNAAPWPVAGLYNAAHYADKVRSLYKNGLPSGSKTGISAGVDNLYSVVPGQLSVVTGVPGSGKTEFVDQVTLSMAIKHGWSLALASFENPPDFHIAKLAEKYSKSPFFVGASQRMSDADLDEAIIWINQHYSFIEQSDGLPTTIETILERAKVSVMRSGARGLVIDPYNYIERDPKLSETEYVSHLLTQVRRFAIAHDAHVWFVAHPAKLYRTDGSVPIPTGYDIAGSAHWINKADFGLTVHRDYEAGNTLLRVWKSRFRWMGQVGDAILLYDTLTGTYRGAPVSTGPSYDSLGRVGSWREKDGDPWE